MKHIYVGPMTVGVCADCGKSGHNTLLHYFNACTEPCDMIEYACACGAYHYKDDFPEEVVERWYRIVNG